MLFPIESLSDLTDDGLRDLEFQVEQELERRAELCSKCREEESTETGPDGERYCDDCYAEVIEYQPRRIQDFAGLNRAKAIMANFVKSPRPDSFLFHGASGTGKTTLALAVAAELNAQIIHIPAAECSVDKVRWLRDVTACAPMFGKFYCVVVDEADRMSASARVAFLSLLDATGMPWNLN